MNLISALRQLHDHFGPGFMISLVPEGTQIPSGYPSYGGQFGSYLPITYAIRDILSFIDVQDYNTPPLEGLDGEIYQPGTVDYHAAMTELLLHGFNVGGDPEALLPADAGQTRLPSASSPETTPAIVSQAMDYIITGKAPAGTHLQAAQPGRLPRHDRRDVLDHRRRPPPNTTSPTSSARNSIAFQGGNKDLLRQTGDTRVFVAQCSDLSPRC